MKKLSLLFMSLLLNQSGYCPESLNVENVKSYPNSCIDTKDLFLLEDVEDNSQSSKLDKGYILKRCNEIFRDEKESLLEENKNKIDLLFDLVETLDNDDLFNEFKEYVFNYNLLQELHYVSQGINSDDFDFYKRLGDGIHWDLMIRKVILKTIANIDIKKINSYASLNKIKFIIYMIIPGFNEITCLQRVGNRNFLNYISDHPNSHLVSALETVYSALCIIQSMKAKLISSTIEDCMLKKYISKLDEQLKIFNEHKKELELIVDFKFRNFILKQLKKEINEIEIELMVKKEEAESRKTLGEDIIKRQAHYFEVIGYALSMLKHNASCSFEKVCKTFAEANPDLRDYLNPDIYAEYKPVQGTLNHSEIYGSNNSDSNDGDIIWVDSNESDIIWVE